nr:MAG TPA: hypothetical protein [Caudoviricetes sp.]
MDIFGIINLPKEKADQTVEKLITQHKLEKTEHLGMVRLCPNFSRLNTIKNMVQGVP